MSRWGPDGPRLTFFHVLWLTLALSAAFATFFELRHAAWLLRWGAALGALIGGLFVAHLLVSFLVIYVVIPRVERGSMWEYEVDCDMRSVLPGQWPD